MATARLLTVSMAIAATAILCSCGGSSNSSPTTQRTVATPAKGEPAANSPPAGPGHVVRRPDHGLGAPGPGVSRHAFVAKANAACRAVQLATRASGRGGQVPDSRDRFDNAAVLERTIDILLRLRPPPPPSFRSPIAHLLTSLQRLRQLFATPAVTRRRTGKQSAVPPGLHEAEQRAAGEALAAGLPDCIPANLSPR